MKHTQIKKKIVKLPQGKRKIAPIPKQNENTALLNEVFAGFRAVFGEAKR